MILFKIKELNSYINLSFKEKLVKKEIKIDPKLEKEKNRKK